ncbi:MAG: hypothetical protein ACM3PV_11040 [Betaproteobacteria bacterium]
MRHTSLGLSLLLALGACGGSRPSDPPSERLPDAASLIPVAPAPQPTATPTPGSEPAEEPWPAVPGSGDGASGTCGEPAPPPISSIAIKVHGGTGDRLLLDSTPLVGPDVAYCREIGYTDGRAYCPVRPEGNPERVACEAARVGRASDTGRVGPTWTVDGRPCDGSGAVTSCVNHPTNQFQVYAYGAGTFRACASNGACGSLKLP